MLSVAAAIAPSVLGFQVPAPLAAAPAGHRVAASPAMIEFDMSTVLGLGAAFVGIGGGIGLIAVTENAGKRNDELANDQPCVVCKAVKVVPCTVCQGTGQDQFAQYVAAVQEEAGEVNDSGGSTVLVDDWDSGPKAVRNALPTSFPAPSVRVLPRPCKLRQRNAPLTPAQCSYLLLFAAMVIRWSCSKRSLRNTRSKPPQMCARAAKAEESWSATTARVRAFSRGSSSAIRLTTSWTRCTRAIHRTCACTFCNGHGWMPGWQPPCHSSTLRHWQCDQRDGFITARSFGRGVIRVYPRDVM